MEIIFNQHVSFCSGVCHIKSFSSFLNKIQSVSEKYDVVVQALNGSLIAGFNHINFATEKAFKNFKNNTNEANDLGVEIMRLASGNSQINKSFSIGLTEGENDCLFVIVGSSDESVKKAFDLLSEIVSMDGFDNFLDRSNENEIIKYFNITKEEICATDLSKNTIEDLVIERVALTDFLK